MSPLSVDVQSYITSTPLSTSSSHSSPSMCSHVTPSPCSISSPSHVALGLASPQGYKKQRKDVQNLEVHITPPLSSISSHSSVFMCSHVTPPTSEISSSSHVALGLASPQGDKKQRKDVLSQECLYHKYYEPESLNPKCYKPECKSENNIECKVNCEIEDKLSGEKISEGISERNTEGKLEDDAEGKCEGSCIDECIANAEIHQALDVEGKLKEDAEDEPERNCDHECEDIESKCKANAQGQQEVFSDFKPDVVDVQDGQITCWMCDKICNCNEHKVQCDKCSIWYHIDCMGFSEYVCEVLSQSRLTWICRKCGMSNYTDCLFHDFWYCRR